MNRFPRRQLGVGAATLLCILQLGVGGVGPHAAAAGAPRVSDPGGGVHALQQAAFSSLPAVRIQPQLAAGVTSSPALITDGPRPTREVFGFAPYWELGNWQDWHYNLLTTVSYFGITLDSSGMPVTGTDAGWLGWQSANLSSLVQAAHTAHDRVLLTIKVFNDADISSICGSSQHTQTAIAQTIGLLRNRGLDGVTVDFEGSSSPSYPGIQSCFTAFMTSLDDQVHAALPGSEVVVATYSGSASWTGGIFNIGDLAPHTDAFFVMAYDMYQSASTASANAPLNGGTYNDTSTVAQYLALAPAAKIILGVPYYGYKWSVATPGVNVPATPPPAAGTYASISTDFACAQQLSQHWDGTAASPYAQWYSPAANDPCGGNYGSARELYYDNVDSLALKYDLVRRSGIRGMGIWALGYDAGHAELWNLIQRSFTPWEPATWLGGAGSDRQLWVSQAPTAYAPYGGVMAAAPAVISSNGVPYFIVVGSDAALYVRRPDVGWARLSPGYTACLDRPAAALQGGVLTVMCTAPNHSIWYAQGAMPAAGLPSVSGFHAFDGSAAAGGGVTVVNGVLTFFVPGTDGNVYLRTQGGGWMRQPWRVLGSVTAASAGGVAHVGMHGTDGHLWVGTLRDGGAWSTSYAGGQLLAGPGVAAYPDGSARIFVEGTDHAVWDTLVNANGAAAGFSGDGGIVQGGVGAAS
ncbi:MAG: glycosyl hydrolase family 18 protein [Candidatus Dormibacteria bacterium]